MNLVNSINAIEEEMMTVQHCLQEAEEERVRCEVRLKQATERVEMLADWIVDFERGIALLKESASLV